MDYNTETLEDLKKLAKLRNIKVGNISRERLIEKLAESDMINSVIENKEDFAEEKIEKTNDFSNNNKTLIESISEAIDNLDEASNERDDYDDSLELDTSIPVKSITFGGLTYKSKLNNAVIRWNQIGAIQYMTIAELNEMNNYSSDFLNKPLVVLMDERAVKKFRLSEVYENVAKINNLTEIFKKDIHIIEKVIDNALNVNMRDILISKVRQMYNTKKLTDINVIRLLENKLNFDLSNS